MLDDNEAVDFAAQKGVQECRVIAERDASIRLAVGSEHVRMRKYAAAAEHVAVSDRSKTDRAHSVKKLLAHRQRVDVRWRRSSGFCAYVANVVHVAACGFR